MISQVLEGVSAPVKRLAVCEHPKKQLLLSMFKPLQSYAAALKSAAGRVGESKS